MLRSAQILSALAPMHVHMGMHGARAHTYEGCYVLPAKGDGACCFTSLRLSVEVEEAMRSALRILDGEDDAAAAGMGTTAKPLLQGLDPVIVAEGAYVRKCVVEWYHGNTHLEVPEMGAFTHGGRMWTRGDILDTEMIRKGKDLPSDEGRKAAMRLAYLNEMLQHSTWASVPEWMAFAMIRRRTTITYQWDAATLRLRQVDGAGKPLARDLALLEAQWPPAAAVRIASPKFHSPGSEDDLGLYDPLSEAVAAGTDADAEAAEADEADADADAGADADAEACAEEMDGPTGAADDASPAAPLAQLASELDAENDWTPAARLLFSGSHYDCILTAQEYFSIRAAFGPEAVAAAIPLPEYVGRR